MSRRPLMGLFLVACVAAFCTGCVTIAFDEPAWNWPWADEPQGEIAQVAAIWADGLVMQPDPAQNGKVMPGFAGRVYFFTPDMASTRKAEGMIVVSLYDNTQPSDPEPPAKEIWSIDEGSLQRVQKKDALGFGYNLWLPWSTISPQSTTVTLIVEYRERSGRTLWSAPTTFPVRTEGGFQRPTSVQVNHQTKN